MIFQNSQTSCNRGRISNYRRDCEKVWKSGWNWPEAAAKARGEKEKHRELGEPELLFVCYSGFS